MSFYERFLATLAAKYPETARTIDLKERVFPQLICPARVELPSSMINEARSIVSAFHALRETSERAELLRASAPPVIDPGNYSILMSYDFHVDEHGRLRLIEINTNASMGLMTELIYGTHGIRNGFTDDFSTEIMNSFREEFSLTFAGRDREFESAAIVDEAPETQRMYIEFALYRELFEKNGLKASIRGPNELSFENGELRAAGSRIDLVYNRDTDFYLEEPRTASLAEAFRQRAACVTPNPHEYRLLADKERLLELSKPGAIESLSISDEHKAIIAKTLIRTHDVSEFTDHDALWAERKRWFFKPARSFGGKAAYRGSSVGRPVFANIVSGSYLAQEYVPAPSMKVETETETGEKLTDEFKYDLRFFVYRDRIQLACARLYKGMMTNMQSPGGGVAAIDWKD